jgi:hypothetical protein
MRKEPASFLLIFTFIGKPSCSVNCFSIGDANAVDFLVMLMVPIPLSLDTDSRYRLDSDSPFRWTLIPSSTERSQGCAIISYSFPLGNSFSSFSSFRMDGPLSSNRIAL